MRRKIGRIKDITGERFGKLVVLGLAPREEKRQSTWFCRCDCGIECTKRGTSLRCGWVQSCGCMSGLDRSPDYLNVVIKWIVRMYVGGAKSRNLEFNLSSDEFIKIIQKPCHYCGSLGRDWGALWYKEKVRRVERGITDKLDERAITFKFIGNGIDRIRNEESYTVANCVPCCAVCNMMKKDLTEKEFLLHIAAIHSYRNV